VPAIEGLEGRLVLSTFNEFPVPGAPDQFAGARITTGPDGNLWYTHFGDHAIGRITPDGSVTEFPIQIPLGDLFDITSGPDGNLWIGTDRLSPSFPNDQTFILRMTPEGDQTYFRARLDDGINTNDFIGGFHGPTVGPDGNLWYHLGLYTSPNEDLLGRITPDGTVTNFTLGTPREGIDGLFSGGMAVGADGNLWVSVSGGLIFRVNPDGQLAGTINTPRGPYTPLREMTTGSDGNVWGVFDNGIERITPDGIVTDFALPTPTQALGMGITAGPDGDVWFTEGQANQIGMITPDGQITEFRVPAPNSQPGGITTGPDGNIWFTELGSGQIGEFVLNDGGGVARSALKAKGTLAVNAATVEALFAGRGRPAFEGVKNSPPAAARVDVAARPPEPVTVPTRPQVRPAAGILTHLHQTDRTAANVVRLLDALAEAV
jgi:streptogramin lyase